MRVKKISNIRKALNFAIKAHDGQYRNGKDINGDKLPYVTHPIEVAKIVRNYKKSKNIQDLVIVALCHDLVEDVEWVTIEVIREEFGDLIASLVDELTSDPKGLEKYGKEQYLINKMSFMSTWGLCIKLADRLHNLSDVKRKMDGGKKSDIKWCVKYCTQTNNIINALEENRTLTDTHKKLISVIKERIEPSLNL